MEGKLHEISTLYSYVIRQDSGFAPNPYYGVLTLACCKPRIRKEIGESVGYSYCSQTGEFISKWKTDEERKMSIQQMNIWVTAVAGNYFQYSGNSNKERFSKLENILRNKVDDSILDKRNSGKNLKKSEHEAISEAIVKPRSLVYIMKVTDVLPLSVYQMNYKEKIPKPNSDNWERYGDNVYIYTQNGIEQRLSCHRCSEDKPDIEMLIRDTSGHYVLLSDCFIYWGARAELDMDLANGLHKGINHSCLKKADDSKGLLPYLEKKLNKEWFEKLQLREANKDILPFHSIMNGYPMHDNRNDSEELL